MSDADARLDALAREDKWYLSGGDGILWAPPFPLWLHRPGLWDEATVFDHPLAPLFSVALLRSDGQEIALQLRQRRWRPDVLERQWETDDGDVLWEACSALPAGRFRSAWALAEASADALRGAHLVAFTAQPGEQSRDARPEDAAAIVWERRLLDRRGAAMAVALALRVEGSRYVRRAGVRSEGSLAQPIWSHTPFPERWREQGLREGIGLQGISDGGFIFLALDAALDGRSALSFEIEMTPAANRLRPPEWRRTRLTSEPRQAWREFLDSFPRFRCSDPYLERYYDYRLYGLRLNRLAGGAGHVRYPAIAEGIGYFHVPITYSAQCHLWEMRWSADPAEAQGSLLNFLENQKPDGSFHGRLYTNDLERTDFYHANWGDAVLGLLAVHPEPGFQAQAHAGLGRYAHWLDRTRDREGSGLYDVVDQYETGQEYMSRYLAVDPEADRYGWENRIRLKGIDVTVYAYQLKRALAELARRQGLAEDTRAWDAGAERIGAALLGTAWDQVVGLFSDVDPRTMQRTGVKAAVCFYPLLTDLLSRDQVTRLVGHLEDPREFATRFPVPSSSLDDPLFSAEAEWKGKRHLCPWNGRVWPMTNSHLVEGLLRQWQRGHEGAGRLAGRLLQQFVHMMFLDGDLARPNCYEHYNPLTGHASAYRGIDDYMHSWVNDLLLRGVTGLEPLAGGLRIHPLPLEVGQAEVTGCRVAGRPVRVERRGQAWRATVDGAHYQGEVGAAVEIRW